MDTRYLLIMLRSDEFDRQNLRDGILVARVGNLAQLPIAEVLVPDGLVTKVELEARTVPALTALQEFFWPQTGANV